MILLCRKGAHGVSARREQVCMSLPQQGKGCTIKSHVPFIADRQHARCGIASSITTSAKEFVTISRAVQRRTQSSTDYGGSSSNSSTERFWPQKQCFACHVLFWVNNGQMYLVIGWNTCNYYHYYGQTWQQLKHYVALHEETGSMQASRVEQRSPQQHG